MRIRGFTLLELSVVLTIISLLAGGVVAGKSIMRAAEIRTILSTLDEYTQAIGHFQEKYEELPGDMSRATQVWGAHGTCPGSSATPSTGLETCDGDGNGLITHTTLVALPNWLETYRAWQHLAAAGMIEGRFIGVPLNNTMDFSLGINANIPDGKVPGMGVAIQHYVSTAVAGIRFASDYGNVLEYGALFRETVVNNGIWPIGGAMSGREMFNFDTKVDDGRPGFGKIMTFVNGFYTARGLAPCTSDNDPSLANYVLTTNERTCHIIYKTGY